MISVIGFILINEIFHGKAVPNVVKVKSDSAKGKKTTLRGGGDRENLKKSVTPRLKFNRKLGKGIFVIGM